MEILGFIGAFAVGFTMGLLGGGGSVLSIPILVYLFRIDAVLATSYSLFIVGFTSLIGSVQKFVGGLVDFKVAMIFGIPSLFFVYLTRAFLLPSMPEVIARIGNFTLSKSVLILAFFAVLMMIASFSMIRKGKSNTMESSEPIRKINPFVLGLYGAIFGLLTGFVGAGGGFICVPIFVLMVGLSMKVAVGTSLFVILIKSIVGFIGDIQTDMAIDWIFISQFTALAALGIIIGTIISKRISNQHLKTTFGWFILLLAIFILIKEIILQ